MISNAASPETSKQCSNNKNNNSSINTQLNIIYTLSFSSLLKTKEK